MKTNIKRFKFLLFFTLFFTAQFTFSSSDEFVDQIWNELYSTDTMYPDIEYINKLAQGLSEKDNINKKFYGDGTMHHVGFIGNLLMICTLYPRALSTIKKLISLKVSLNEIDETGQTPLFYATHYNIYENALALLQAGADQNIQDKNGKTALMHTNNILMINLFLYFGINTTIQDNEGKTIFDEPYFKRLHPTAQEDLIRNKEQAQKERQATTCIMHEHKRYNTNLFGTIQNLLGTPNYPQT